MGRSALAIVVASSLLHVGCNEYHAPIDIDPRSEVPAGTQYIHTGNVKIRVPGGWTVSNVLRDDAGRAAWITLYHDERGRRGRGLDFCLFDSLPSEASNLTDIRVSTRGHRDFLCHVNVEQEPSGDDTPGRYVVQAYVQAGHEWWRMTATFTSPVRPDLATAIDYIDALEIVDAGN